MKKFLYIFILFAYLLYPAPARADIEILQKVLTVLKRIQDQTGVVLQKYKSAKEQVISTYQGVQSARNKFTTQINQLKDIKDVKTFLQTKILPGIKDINNLEKTMADLEKQYLFKLGEGKEIAGSKFQEMKMKAILAENVASMYSKALTMRTTFEDEPKDTLSRSNTQDIIRSTSIKANKIAERYSKIRELDAAYLEFNTAASSREHLSGDEESFKTEQEGAAQ